MSQIVGLNCALCGERIAGNFDSEFCPDCGAAHHSRCRNPNSTKQESERCRTCGSGPEAAVESVRRPGSLQPTSVPIVQTPMTPEERRIWWAIGCLLLIGLAVLTSSIALLLVAALMDRHPDRGFAVLAGLVLLAVTGLIVAATFGLHAGKRWARVVCVAMCMLSLLSVLFPVAVGGLILLLNERAWSTYVQSRAEKQQQSSS